MWIPLLVTVHFLTCWRLCRQPIRSQSRNCYYLTKTLTQNRASNVVPAKNLGFCKFTRHVCAMVKGSVGLGTLSSVSAMMSIANKIHPAYNPTINHTWEKGKNIMCHIIDPALPHDMVSRSTQDQSQHDRKGSHHSDVTYISAVASQISGNFMYRDMMMVTTSW